MGTWNAAILNNFAAWYIWVVVFFVIVCLGLAIWPTAGRLNLVQNGETPEFSKFSWFSMMFGAGIGVGMLTWAVAEPVAHFKNNPAVIQGVNTALGADNVREAYVWSHCLLSWAHRPCRRCQVLARVSSGFPTLTWFCRSCSLGSLLSLVQPSLVRQPFW